jgi:hypothetical protein
MGGSQGGSQSFSYNQLPAGWRSGTKDFGKSLKNFSNDPLYKQTLSSALDWFAGLSNKAESSFKTAEDALTSQATDPMRLTNPFFIQSRESLGGNLVERSRQMGMTSGDAATSVNTGLSDFTNRYLNSSLESQRAAALGLTALPGARAQLGSALFTPYQAASQTYLGMMGASRPAPQPGSSNSKAQMLGALGQLGGSYDWSSIGQEGTKTQTEGESRTV